VDGPDSMRAGPSPGPADDLTATVYNHLRAIAQHRVNQERPGHTLQATALVNEAYLRLAEAGVAWSGPGAFYHAAAEAMRRILIDHARARGTAKRGGGRRPLDVDDVLDLAAADDPAQVLALEGAVSRLEKEDARAAEVVRLRFYAGLTVDQTAAAMGQSRRTVLRDWEFARAWLVEDLERAQEPGPP
jgi:RNA polymerase sigma factor (TIGR02999 family)